MRAVANVMRANPMPLKEPAACHQQVGAQASSRGRALQSITCQTAKLSAKLEAARFHCAQVKIMMKR